MGTRCRIIVVALVGMASHSWLFSFIVLVTINIIAGAVLQAGDASCFMPGNAVVMQCLLFGFGNLPLLFFKLF